MKKSWKDMKAQFGSHILAACMVVLFFVAITHIGPIWAAVKYVFRIFLPIIIGFAIAYILHPFVAFNNRTVFKAVSRGKIRWALSVILTLVLTLSVLSLLVYSIIPQLIVSIKNFADNFENYATSLRNWLDGLNLANTGLTDSLDELLSHEGGILSKTMSLLLDNLNDIVKKSSELTGTALNVGMGMILAVYFLFDKKRVTGWCARLAQLTLSQHYYDRTMEVGNRFNQIFASYITCELIDASIVGIATYLFMLLMKMEYSVLIAVVCGVTNLVPTFGPIVGFIFGGIMLLLVDPIDALIFAVFTIVLQVIDGYVIKPYMFGDALNVPGVVILMASIIFGKMMGVIGIFLSIPLSAIIVYILRAILVPKAERHREAKNQDTEK